MEPPWTIPRDELGSLFAVPKSEAVDRVVFNRVPRNAKELHLPGFAKFCIGGHDLTDLIAPQGHAITLYSDDLNDAFPSFRASRARAVSNGIAWTAPADAFEGTYAHKMLVYDCHRIGRAMPARVRPSHSGLAHG